MLAILVGTAVCTAWTPGRRWFVGIDFSAKSLLEIGHCHVNRGWRAGAIRARMAG